jgi:CTP:molybdopterin cytidylyltransferase MocA
VDEILSQPPDAGCKEWRRAQRARVIAWPSDKPSYVTDVDTPQDLDRLQNQHGWVFQWP